jgi:hypothetical protein
VLGENLRFGGTATISTLRRLNMTYSLGGQRLRHIQTEVEISHHLDRRSPMYARARHVLSGDGGLSADPLAPRRCYTRALPLSPLLFSPSTTTPFNTVANKDRYAPEQSTSLPCSCSYGIHLPLYHQRNIRKRVVVVSDASRGSSEMGDGVGGGRGWVGVGLLLGGSGCGGPCKREAEVLMEEKKLACTRTGHGDGNGTDHRLGAALWAICLGSWTFSCLPARFACLFLYFSYSLLIV